jgi:hypothetical protein
MRNLGDRTLHAHSKLQCSVLVSQDPVKDSNLVSGSQLMNCDLYVKTGPA